MFVDECHVTRVKPGSFLNDNGGREERPWERGCVNLLKRSKLSSSLEYSYHLISSCSVILITHVLKLVNVCMHYELCDAVMYLRVTFELSIATSFLRSWGPFLESPDNFSGARFSKVPITFRVRKAICETGNRLFWKFQSFEASNRGQFSCRCTLDQWLDLIGVISS